ncbi:hypothetical protein ELY33_15850 [Vreelandella andesensis]|uniref:Uncharacterized protein n=1 Tax=Vreelandella andesensis TaxID=447567 RepID=A0A3S1DIJ6_9GAMM|nr:hypothetical protein [Halomonas andesensis]RUR27371.1 hypothetical protein ELY33_15850 [Halomonas andesensis]
MPFKPVSFFLTALIGTALATPLLAAEQALTLPKGASVGVEVIEKLAFTGSQARHEGILLHPTQTDSASHELPEYCVLVANAQLTNGRIRITTQDATCIETHDTESAIFTGEFSAGAYATDGQYGLACDESNCSLSPGQAFVVTLDKNVDINAQDNPSAEINAARRQADGDGVANPIPSDRPDPDESAENPRSINQPE